MGAVPKGWAQRVAAETKKIKKTEKTKPSQGKKDK